ncbi:hypothetical protein K0M31_007348 [Melipona bicolor]|uniref:Uncharacterized protein n=1 Tax=Melipona bicolor TaxID=60889 RepID=A0AA40KVM6_9HYME|nr:hypothetical protein K0M31_007348 [Melipona bicolor]
MAADTGKGMKRDVRMVERRRRRKGEGEEENPHPSFREQLTLPCAFSGTKPNLHSPQVAEIRTAVGSRCF